MDPDYYSQNNRRDNLQPLADTFLQSPTRDTGVASAFGRFRINLSHQSQADKMDVILINN